MNEIFEHTNYRSYLKSVLAERVTKNPSYSLRAMAKALDVQSSHLSSVQNGVKNLSSAAAHKVAGKLGLASLESEYFCVLVQCETEKNPDLKDQLMQRLKDIRQKAGVGGVEFRDLSIDAFKMIADWYHIPILAMAGLDNADLAPEHIAKQLGIRVLEARAALERLERLELLERDARGRLRKTIDNPVFRSPEPNTALRRFHRAMLEKAIESLEAQSNKEKFVGSQTLAIDPRQLPQAFEKIEKFRKEFVEFFDADNTKKNRTAVYHLNMTFFNLTPNSKGENQ